MIEGGGHHEGDDQGREQGQRINPEKVKRHLLATKGEVDVTDHRIGILTWTSKEVIETMLTTGTLNERSGHLQRGEITGNALPGLEAAGYAVPETPVVRSILDDPVSNQALEQAKVRADMIGKAHGLLDELGQPINNPALTEAAEAYTYAKNMTKLAEGLPTNRIESEIADEINASSDLLSQLPPDAFKHFHIAAENASGRKGIILGLTVPKKDSGFHVGTPIEPNDDIVRFQYGGEGPSYKDIAVIEPLGDEETILFETFNGSND